MCARGVGGARGCCPGADGVDGRQDIYLVPGFFGFANLGRLTCFGHVRRILAVRVATLGLGGEHAGAELVNASAAGSLATSRTSLGAKHARAS